MAMAGQTKEHLDLNPRRIPTPRRTQIPRQAVLDPIPASRQEKGIMAGAVKAEEGAVEEEVVGVVVMENHDFAIKIAPDNREQFFLD